MRLVDYLDKGASLGPDRPCLATGDRVLTYADVQRLSFQVAGALASSGIEAGANVAILSGNDPVAFSCVFGISRRGAVWSPINPRNEAQENRALLELFDCCCLIFQAAFAPLVQRIAPQLSGLTVLVCLDGDGNEVPGAIGFEQWLSGGEELADAARQSADTTAMLVGTGGTTGLPKAVMLSEGNLETMTAITLMSYPFQGRPTYLALAPLTHAAGVLCFPILALGGQVIVMAHADVGEFLELIAKHQVTHTFLPPTVIYLLLSHEKVRSTDVSSLQCFWYGAAPMSASRLAEALEVFGPVMAQLFGQSEAPMMISTMAPAEHYLPDGSIATNRLSSAGRPAPLVTVAVMDGAGNLLGTGERGEIVVRGSLVMSGYYRNLEATAEVSLHGWHHTGDIGYLDDENYLFIVDRAKDMIISGGFNVYSAEVEQALMQHPDVHEAAVVGMPDEKWGERVTAVVQPVTGHESLDTEAVIAFVKARLGSVKAPKQLEVWPDLPRSKVGKVLKAEIRVELLKQQSL